MVKQDSTSKSSRSSITQRSKCPVACTLDVLGDKWSLLVVKDMFLGKSTYSDFQNSDEGIPTNILAERLKRLEQNGIIVKQQYQQRPVRYAYKLTDKGQDLGPILMAVVEWGNKHLSGVKTSAEVKKLTSKAP